MYSFFLYDTKSGEVSGPSGYLLSMTEQNMEIDDMPPARWELRTLGEGEFEFVEPIWPAEVDDLLDEAFDALEENSIEEAKEIVEQALEVAPENLEAWNLMADICFDLDDDRGRLKACQRAMDVIHSYMPKGFHAKDYLLPGDLEGNALFLRAYAAYGSSLADAGQLEEARKAFEDLLHFDPEDPQNARNVLPSIYLELKEPTQIMVLRDKFPHDQSADILWNIPLAFMHLDEADMARVALKDALAKSPKVAAVLLSGKPVAPKELGEEVVPGSQEEAFLYATEMLPLWKSTKGALGLLREIAG